MTIRKFVFFVRLTDNTGHCQHSRPVAIGRNEDRGKSKCGSLYLGGVGSEAQTPSKNGREIRIQYFCYIRRKILRNLSTKFLNPIFTRTSGTFVLPFVPASEVSYVCVECDPKDVTMPQ